MNLIRMRAVERQQGKGGQGLAFMRLAVEILLDIETTRYPIGEANRALADLRERKMTGAVVLVIR